MYRSRILPEALQWRVNKQALRRSRYFTSIISQDCVRVALAGGSRQWAGGRVRDDKVHKFCCLLNMITLFTIGFQSPAILNFVFDDSVLVAQGAWLILLSCFFLELDLICIRFLKEVISLVS